MIEIPPEIPYPFRPWQEPPRRTTPISVPVVEMPPTAPRDRLFDRRTALLSGRLDGRAVTDVCAQLMALDGQGGDAVELIVNSAGGPVGEIAALLDVIELMRVKVNTMCVGAAGGTAAVVLACSTGERRAGSNARISLRVEEDEVPAAPAAELQRRVEERAAQLSALAELLARTTRQSIDVMARELDDGAVRSATEALTLGLIDRVVERS